MKKKLIISMIALVLCGVFIFTACAPLSDGEGLKEKIESWFGKEDDKSDSDDTTKAPQDSGTVTTVPGDTTGDAVTTESVGSKLLKTNSSDEFVCGYAEFMDGFVGLYFGFSLEEELTRKMNYRICWDFDTDLISQYNLKPMEGFYTKYGIQITSNIWNGEVTIVEMANCHEYAASDDLEAFKNMVTSGGYTFTAFAQQDEIYVFLFCEETLLEASAYDSIVQIIREHIAVSLYEIS